LDRVVVLPVQTFVAPVILPASGSGFTVTTLVATPVHPPLVTEYEIVAVPAATPVTIPVALPTVAFAVLDDDHIPPLVALLRVLVLPTHTLAVPVIVPAAGAAFTVTTAVAIHPGSEDT
jgi:hypothetical protein